MNHEVEKLQRELEGLKKEYQEFAYVVSHDFNAPFRQIEGFATLIAERNADQFDEKTRKHFDLIMKGTAKCQKMLGSLLAFSRLNTMAAPFDEVDCNTVFEEAKQPLAKLIEESNAQINCDTLPSLEGDKSQLRQLFYQLLKNALQYQKPGAQPVINISVQSSPEVHTFKMIDNGIDIPEKQLNKVFVVLRRAIDDDEAYPGEGMGLAIARKIVHRHGREIAISSTENEGTIVTFSLSSTPQ